MDAQDAMQEGVPIKKMDVVNFFYSLINQNPQISMPVAAIQALSETLQASQGLQFFYLNSITICTFIFMCLYSLDSFWIYRRFE